MNPANHHVKADSFLVAVLMGAMHGQSIGFLSLSMPNTFSFGWGYIEKYKREKGLECPDRDCFEVLRNRVIRMLDKGTLPGSGEIIDGDVRDLSSKIKHDSIQLLFTSPPYLKVIKYGIYNWIRLWFLLPSGDYKEVDKVLDDTHALGEYLEFMKLTLTATLPLMDRERGLSCWAIGDVKGLNLAWAVWHHVEYVNAEEEIVESIGSWKKKDEANKALKNSGEKDGLFLRLRTEKTNDKSGKATDTDRILVIAPDSATPSAFCSPENVSWDQFSTQKMLTLHDFSS